MKLLTRHFPPNLHFPNDGLQLLVGLNLQDSRLGPKTMEKMGWNHCYLGIYKAIYRGYFNPFTTGSGGLPCSVARHEEVALVFWKKFFVSPKGCQKSPANMWLKRWRWFQVSSAPWSSGSLQETQLFGCKGDEMFKKETWTSFKMGFVIERKANFVWAILSEYPTKINLFVSIKNKDLHRFGTNFPDLSQPTGWTFALHFSSRNPRRNWESASRIWTNEDEGGGANFLNANPEWISTYYWKIGYTLLN